MATACYESFERAQANNNAALLEALNAALFLGTFMPAALKKGTQSIYDSKKKLVNFDFFSFSDKASVVSFLNETKKQTISSDKFYKALDQQGKSQFIR